MKAGSGKSCVVRGLFLVFAIGLAPMLAGCGAIIQSATYGSFPTFAETEKLWPPLGADKGRVVIYMPRAGILRDIGVVPPVRKVTVDNRHVSPLYATGFIFIDLKPGEHRVAYLGNWFITKGLGVSVAGKETKFVRIRWAEILVPRPQLVAEQEARRDLQKIRHDYRKPLPFTRQRR